MGVAGVVHSAAFGKSSSCLLNRTITCQVSGTVGCPASLQVKSEKGYIFLLLFLGNELVFLAETKRGTVNSL